MKSETRNKIKESRRKYFQEVMKHQAEQIGQPQPQTKRKSADVPVPDYAPTTTPRAGFDLQAAAKRMMTGAPKWDPANSWHQLKGKMPEVAIPVLLHREDAANLLKQISKPLGKAGREISSARQRISFAVNQRTDMAITRFNDYMMVIFDA